ncbi:diacylglycerol kinase family protein [bacterium]|nr:diacylglycerol kinase family protein [bacterium]
MSAQSSHFAPSNPPADFMSLDPQANKTAVIVSVNPNSGSSDQSKLITLVEEKLHSAGFEPNILTDIAEVASESKRLNDAGKLRAVVAAGGDGTVSLLANTIDQNIPLAILPLGTENLLAKYLNLTADPNRLLKLLQNGVEKKLDAGRANGKLFLVMASCGFDASVVEKLHSARKGHISHLSYFRPILSSLRWYRYPKLSITIDDEETVLSACWLFLFNVSRYAMNLPIAPEADPCDGFLNMCSFRGRGNLRGIFYLTSVLLRKHRQWCTTEFRKFRKMTITSNDPNSAVPFQLDGDPGGYLPLEIEAVSEYLTVLTFPDTTDGANN